MLNCLCLQRNCVPLCVSGDCNFERPYSSCGYSQGRDDDLDWEQANTLEKPPTDQWMPTGESAVCVRVCVCILCMYLNVLTVCFGM